MTGHPDEPSVSPSPHAATAVATQSRRSWHRALMTGLVGVVTLALMVLGVVVLVTSGVDIFKLQSAVSRLRLFGVVLQMLIVALIGLRWRALVSWGQRRGIVQPHEFERVIALRPKATAFLCAYLVLIPIGPQTLFRLLGMG
jgi:urea transporter